MAFSDTSGTLRPNARWKASRSSSGGRGSPAMRASVAAQCTANLEPVSARYRVASPSVTVRGVACRISWPSTKSSKKLPRVVLLMSDPKCAGRSGAGHDLNFGVTIHALDSASHSV